MGTSFDVKIGITPLNIDYFTASYNASNSRVCVSLDDAPYSCWSVFGGRIRFINAVEGPHTLKAVLMRRGEIVGDTVTETMDFTTVEDPDIESSDGVAEDKDNDEVVDLDEKDERVRMDIPSLQMQVPPEKVTLPGTAVQVVSNVKVEDSELFDKVRGEEGREMRLDYICIRRKY